MSNALLPTLSTHLQYGNNEILLENFTANCMQMEDLICQSPNSGLYMESTLIPPQSQSLSLIQQGSLYVTSSNKGISQQWPSNRPSDPPYDVARGNTRKRPFEAFDDNSETNNTNLKDTSHKIPKNNSHPPVRRNQKLSDKITTLQKLVSPFGKTDTASVLQEASLYIRLLHEQILNLCQMLSFSYSKTLKVNHHKQMCYGEREVDLRSKGLCLVPISSVTTQKVITMEDQIHRNAVSRRFDYKLPTSF